MSETAPQNYSILGQTLKLEYRYYPSALPLRIEIEDVVSRRWEPFNLKGLDGWQDWQTQTQKNLIKHPWLSRRPCLLKKMKVEVTQNQKVLSDTQKKSKMYFDTPYAAMTCDTFSGGAPIHVFAIGQAGQLEVLSLFREGVGMSLDQKVILRNIQPSFEPNPS